MLFALLGKSVEPSVVQIWFHTECAFIQKRRLAKMCDSFGWLALYIGKSNTQIQRILFLPRSVIGYIYTCLILVHVFWKFDHGKAHFRWLIAKSPMFFFSNLVNKVLNSWSLFLWSMSSIFLSFCLGFQAKRHSLFSTMIILTRGDVLWSCCCNR